MKKYIIALAVMLFGAGLMAYAGGKITHTQQIYREGDIAYANLRWYVKENTDHRQEHDNDNITHSSKQQQKNPAAEEIQPQGENTQTAPAKIPQLYIPEQNIDFEKLEQINKDAAAWLYSPGTEIDYPVMAAQDYNYYLRHLPDGTWNINGSLFIDYNCAPDFSGPLTVIYGHHMKSGDMMFGSLKWYKDQAYYEKHPYIYLYTKQGDYRIDLIYGAVIAAGKWREQAFMFPENVEAFLAYAESSTTFESETKYQKGDRVVALSTCSYEFDGARYVVLGILRSPQ